MEDKEIIMPKDNPVISELDLREPPQEIVDYAREELGEDPETRCQAIAEFRDLIYERGECTPIRTDDGFLLRFLRTKNFVIRHAHRLLVNYCEFREDNPEFFEDVHLNILKRAGKWDLITVPPYREQNGRRILLYRAGLWDPTKFSVEDMFRATMLILELAEIEPKFQIKGGVGMFDLGGVTAQQAWYFTPSIAKKIFDIMVTSFPVRLHCVHVVNQPWIFDTIYNFFKPFMSEEMRERVYIHGDDMESLHKHIDPLFLPKRYGGVHPDYPYKDWIDFFKRDEKIRWELKHLGYIVDDNDDDDDDDDDEEDKDS